MRKYINTEEKFWSYVDQSNGPDTCWPWIKTKTPLGYGKYSYRGKLEYTHILAFRFTHGPHPEHKPQTLHICDNPCCCNPDHLKAGTIVDNMHDRDSKGRWRKGSSENFRRGSAHYRAKLNELAIKEILRKLNLGETQKAIAKEFEISPQLVSGVKRGLYWKHVARPR